MNQTSGSAGQKGGSLVLTAALVGVGSADGMIASGSELESTTHSIMEDSVVAIESERRAECSLGKSEAGSPML